MYDPDKIICKLWIPLGTYTKKRGSSTVTRPTLRGLRIAHCRQNEQRRSPRRYVQFTHRCTFHERDAHLR